jgi:hypothetical protein
VWKKRISYSCRKKVADKRLRIKGRFISKAEAVNLRESEKSKIVVKEEVKGDLNINGNENNKKKEETPVNNPSAPNQEAIGQINKKADSKPVFSILPNTPEQI